MRSPYASTEESHSESDFSQDEDDFQHSGNCAGVVSANTNHHRDRDNIDTCSDLMHAGRQHPNLGMLATAARHDARNTDTAYNSAGNQSSHHIPTSSSLEQPDALPPTGYYHDEDEDEGEDDEDMSDIEGGAYLELGGSTGSHPVGTSLYHSYGSASDDVDDSDLDLAQDSDSDESLPTQPFDTYLNPNGLPNFSSQSPALYGVAVMMNTEPPPQAWVGANSYHGILPVPNVDMATFDPATDPFPPVQLSNPNPTVPGAENLGLVDFLRSWAYQGSFAGSPRSRPPHLNQVLKQSSASPKEVTYLDLNGDDCDIQGLNWTAMETTRSHARTRRCQTYKNYVNHHGSDLLAPHMDDNRIPSYESFFRFRRMDFQQDVHLAHFQLRSILACPSRAYAYYPSSGGVNRFNRVSRTTDVVMSMRDFPTMGAALSTLDAACGVLMGGTFGGDYYLKSLDCDDKSRFAEGQITSDFSGITNHIKIYRPRRSSGPVAAIASNDCGFRIMDIGTEHFISEKTYPFALNCSALSPDHRLRVLVGDSSEAFITNADTGEVLQELAGHRDYGFACDWSDDGRTVATGFQDRGIKIWDARRWCNSSGVSTPLCTIRSEMASVRGLRFSPLGSGKPVLVAAEEADYINIIDAQTFASKQTIDVFGEIGGVSFANDGQDLDILSCDKHRGGLIQLERCGRRPEPLLDILGQQRSQRSRYLVEDEEAQFQDRWVRNREPSLHYKHLEPF